ncbi:MAG: hypothetical protein ACRDUY_09485 [Nitriliruptorales bacterium]
MAFVLVALALFIFALDLMKTGAQDAAPLFRARMRIQNPLDALGFGWLFAYVVLSGSPVAAATLTFLSGGVISTTDAYAMIAGSRLGASMVVILLGFLYVLRGRQTTRGLTTGLLAMLVTATIYVPALILGLAVLEAGVVPTVAFEVPVLDAIGGIYGPTVEAIGARLPGGWIFLLGTVTMVGSFSLFDRGLPDISLGGATLGERFVFRPIVMFLAGLAVTALTMSVSVSVGLLVPVSARGLVRRENVVPYVMGCNVSTFVDTLFVALLLRTAEGFTVVLIEMLSVAVVSLVVLAIGFETYRHVLDRAADWAVDNGRNLAASLGALVLVPLLLVAC